MNPYHVHKWQKTFFELLDIGADDDPLAVFEIEKRIADIRLNHDDFGRKKF